MGTSKGIGSALDIAAGLCRHFEGFSARPYICPAGYHTIGYGTVWKPDGSRVTMADPAISKATAEEWLTSELRTNYLAGVLSASPILALYPDAWGAMGDFAYNLGVARYRASTLRKRIDAADWDGAKVQLMRWTKAGGRELPGLVRRRLAESKFL